MPNYAVIETLKRNEHLFFDFVVDLITALTSLGIACELQRYHHVSPYTPTTKLVIAGNSTISGVEMHFSPAKLFRDLINDRRPELFRVTIKPISKQPPKHLLNLSVFQGLAGSLAASAFTGFYEKFKKIVKKKFGNEDDWPPIWRFAWVIRNSLSHNGKIAFNDKDKEPVEWSGLKISPGPSTSKVLFDMLTPVELVCLMIDMDKELKHYFTKKQLSMA